MATLSDKTRLAKSMFGSVSTQQQAQSTTMVGEAAESSSGGYVRVVQGEGMTVRLPTICAVNAGDIVQIEVRNGKAVIVGATGWGDLVNTRINTAQSGVSNLQTRVSATENHFWTDESVGAVVSKNEKPATASEITGPNTVIGANGIAIRDGLTELAKFTQNLIELGKNSINAVISLCGGAGTIKASSESQRSVIISPTIETEIGSKAELSCGFGTTNLRNYGVARIAASDSNDYLGSFVETRGAQYTVGGSVLERPSVRVRSNGFSGTLYGWTKVAEITGSTYAAIAISTAMEVMVVAEYTDNDNSRFVLSQTVPIDAVGSELAEFRLTGGFSNLSQYSGSPHGASVKLSKSAFMANWYYCGGSDVTASTTFKVYAR